MNIFCVAEIGINHNGDLGICKSNDVAVQAGCDAVKFQKRNIEDLQISGQPPRKSLGTNTA